MSINSTTDTLVPRVAHSLLWPGGRQSLQLVSHKTWTSFSPGMGVSSFGIAKPMAQVLFHILQRGCPSVFCRRKVKFGCPKRGRSSSCLWRGWEISDRCLIHATSLKEMKHTIFKQKESLLIMLWSNESSYELRNIHTHKFWHFCQHV